MAFFEPIGSESVPDPYEEQQARFRQQQERYGEPLADLLIRVGSTLGLSTPDLAGVIGLDVGEVYEFMRGDRPEITDAAAMGRVNQLTALTSEVLAGAVMPNAVGEKVAAIRAGRRSGAEGPGSASADRGTGAGTGSGGPAGPSATTAADRGRGPVADEVAIVEAVQLVFRHAASANECVEASMLLQERFPDLAEVVRTYGAARTPEALAHLRSARRA